MATPKSETNTPAMEARIYFAAGKKFNLAPNDVYFESGQWWVKFWPEGEDADVAAFEAVFGSDVDDAFFAVVDAVGPTAVKGLDFQRL